MMHAAKKGRLNGFPGLTTEKNAKHVGVEYTIKVGHTRAMPKGVRSTSIESNRGRPKTKAEKEEMVAASNKKTHNVFMTVRLADDWMASDQTGTFPRTSSRGNKYISVFYMYDPNFIKGVAIKSRHADELLRAYKEVYNWCEARGIKSELHKMDNETSKEVENFIKGQQKIKGISNCPLVQMTGPN